MAEPLCCCLFMVAMALYFHNTKQNVSNSSSFKTDFKLRLQDVACISIWFFLVIVSLLLKETAITIVGVVIGTSVVKIVFAGEKFKSHVHWLAISLSVLLVYILLRYVIVNLDKFLVLDPNLNESRFITLVKVFIGLLSRANSQEQSKSLYLGDSELIRKAENPFAFLSGLEYALSYAYLHARYMWVLICKLIHILYGISVNEFVVIGRARKVVCGICF